MRLSLSSVLASLVIGIVILGQGEGLARRPGENGDRHFRKSERGPGIFAERLEQRKISREERREKALAATELSASTVKKSAGESEEANVDASERPSLRSQPAKGRDVRSIKGEGRTVRMKRRGPGRGGKGTGPATRRRVVLKPLFGN